MTKHNTIYVYVLYGSKGEYIDYFETLEKATSYKEKLEEWDKANGVQDTYYIEEEEY